MAPQLQEKLFFIVLNIIVDGNCQNLCRIGLAVLLWPHMEADVSVVFRKMEKKTISVGDSILVFGRTIAQLIQRTQWMFYSLTLLLRWWPSKIGLTLSHDFFDEPSPGALKTATTEDDVTKNHDNVLANCQLKMCKIAETVNISKDRVGHILHMTFWAWESWRRNGCHICSLRTTSETGRPL